MKRKLIFPFLILAFLVSGCGTPAKIASTTNTQESWTRTIESAANYEIQASVDTSKHDVTEITLTRREYYPPQSGEGESCDSVKAGRSEGSAGRIKSEEIVTIRTERERKGISQEAARSDTTTIARDSTQISVASTYDSEPAKDPQRFRYIFYIIVAVAVIALAVFLYFKIHGGGWLKITSFFRRL